MTELNKANGEGRKKKSLKDLLKQKPVADVDTSMGKIYLYPLRVQDLSHYDSLDSAKPIVKTRDLISKIGALIQVTDEQPERTPLEPWVSESLSEEEVESIANAYVRSSTFKTRRDDEENQHPERIDGEDSISFLVRLMSDEVEYYKKADERARDRVSGLSQGIFQKLRESTSALGTTLGRFDRLQSANQEPHKSHESILVNQQFQAHNALAQEVRDRALERREEMELARLTGQMTAESAKALKELLDAATTMMELMDERDIKSEVSTSKQIRVAVWSIVLSVILAFIALVFACLSYFQDQNSGVTEDQWQAKLLKAVENGNYQRSVIDQENEGLKDQINAQSAKIGNLEKSIRELESSRKSKKNPS